MNKLFKNAKAFLVLMLALFLLFSIDNVNSLDFSDQNTMYETFVANKENCRYEIETTYKITSSSYGTTYKDVYIFSEDYAYYLNEYKESFAYSDYLEKLIVHGGNGDEYYYRFRKSNTSSINDLGIVPYFQTDDISIVEPVMSFLNSPLFYLDQYYTDSVISFSIDVSKLSLEHRAYIQTDIQSKYPELVIPGTGSIYYTVFFNDNGIYQITISYGSLFPNVFGYTQIIKISSNNTLDIAASLTDKIDIRNVSSLTNNLHPTIGLNQTINFQYSWSSPIYQYVFFEITEANEYVFSLTDDNVSVDPFWYLFDFDLNQYHSILDIEEYSYYFKSHDVSIYLEPGIYYLYLCPRRVGMNTASITLKNRNEMDDHSNGFNPEEALITEDTVVNFTTDYEYDYDVFTVAGDYDYVIIENINALGLAIEKILDIEFTNLSYHYIIEMPDTKQLSLYFSGFKEGQHQVNIRFINYSTVPIPYSEAESINLYTLNSVQRSFGCLGLSFAGGVDRYTFDITEESRLYIESRNSKSRIFDATLTQVNITEENYYLLTPGEYYVEFYNFSELYTVFSLTPEIVSDDIVILNPGEEGYRIYGHIDSINDEDIFQLTIPVDSVLQFDDNSMKSLLFYGVDNPNIYLFNVNIDLPFFIKAGTYYITPPLSSFPYYYSYHFVFNIYPYEEEMNANITYTEVIDNIDITTYHFFASFDYYGDEEILIFDVKAGDILNFTFPSVLNKAVLSYTPVHGVTQTSTISHSGSVTFNQDGQISILFGLYSQISFYQIGSDNQYMIEINVLH
ncbi:MAG: hypothetical protein CVV56_08460 [Tenericutes bacterium HGW-Tenericutes-1]|jgi:hypothetical protein|nr:MAG: hypothetical protein CVV56_08460 [Tenericutes bacterium HGW-Tenericutes-1]